MAASTAASAAAMRRHRMEVLLVGGCTGTCFAYPPHAAASHRCDRSLPMLIGAHVSPAGGPAKAIERGVEKGADAIQIFNQNPRAWKPTVYSDEQVAEFREAMAASRVDALLIHAVYLLNPASEEKEFRDKTRASLIASLRAGDALGAHAVVLHPGSAKTGKVAPAIKRAGKVIAQALSESENCALHLENTAGP